MKILTQPAFLICITIASFIYCASIFNLKLPNWITFYVNDALCMPIVLSICLLGVRTIKKNSRLYIPILPIVVLTLFYALLFEWMLPKSNPRYTSDWIDIVLYALGSLVFYRFQKKWY